MELIDKHEKAMHFSFLAKEARLKGEEDEAIENYLKAATLESEVAEYYFDKPQLEPTRSILIRSAAFLNLKAGAVEKSEKYIFWGLANTQDKIVRDQLYEALELCIAYRKLDPQEVSGNVDYIYTLRQKSILYTIEPKDRQYSSATTLEMISDFSANYTKSIKAFSKSKYKRSTLKKSNFSEDEDYLANEFQKLINPVLTSAGFGSFKFAVATDILGRPGETSEITKLKSNLLISYHDEIFSKDFSEADINYFRSEYSKEELEEIFRPVFNMRTSNAEYRIEYFDRESLTSKQIRRIGGKEKKALLPIRKINEEDIGMLENIIAHTRETDKGFARKVILKQDLTSYTFDFPTRYIDSKNETPIILADEIRINVSFNNQIGFNYSLDELPIQVNSNLFNDGLSKFYDQFAKFFRELAAKEMRIDREIQHWNYLLKIISNPSSSLPSSA
jgi:hypothetical protein